MEHQQADGNRLIAGLYRVTFYMKDNPSSAIILSGAEIGNYIGNTDGTWGTGETNASTPLLMAAKTSHMLTLP